MRVGILTSDDIRHRFFVNTLRSRFDVVCICYQNTGYAPVDVAAAADDAAARCVRAHFARRTDMERRFFGHDAEIVPNSRSVAVRRLDVRSLSAPQTVSLLQDARVDVVAVYGTSLIRNPLLAHFAGRMINLHLGLSPYYRGTATNFYPLVNDEPEYVGATIHLIDAGIDSGPIACHARPEICADDTPHSVGCKAIAAGIDAFCDALEAFTAGRLRPVPQWPVKNARLYLRKDYRPEHVVRLYDLMAGGLFERYVARAERVSARLRLVHLRESPGEPPAGVFGRKAGAGAGRAAPESSLPMATRMV